MTEWPGPAPFATTPEAVADAVVHGIAAGSRRGLRPRGAALGLRGDAPAARGGLAADARLNRGAQARLSGAIRNNSFLRPTVSNWTTASASSPAPSDSSTVPSPQLPWTTRSPAASPSCSAPVVAGARRRRPVASNPPAGPGSPRPNTLRPGVPPSDADVAHQLGGDLVEEPAGDVGAAAPVEHAAPGVGEVEVPLGAGDAHVTQPPLLLELDRVPEGAEVGEDPVLHPDQEDGRELEALGDVHGHQRDLGPVALELVGVGHQRRRLEELGQGPVLGGHADQGVDVLHPAQRLDGPLGEELAPVAGALQHRGDQLPGAEAAGRHVDVRGRCGLVVGRGARGARASPFSSTRAGTAICGAEPVEPLGQVGQGGAGLARRPRPRRRGPGRRRRTRPGCPAHPASLATEVSPTPRLGTLTIRRQLTSSSGLTSTLR